MAKKILIYGIGAAVLIGLLFFVFSANKVNSFATVSGYEGDAAIYKSGSCGCCDVYTNYFKGKSDLDVKVVNLDSLDSIKQEYNIPPAMESCHTLIIGNYFVEGHIPIEAVERLMQEKPDIKGIAMPGMPSGSPGMPGSKRGDFVIYAVNNDGSYKEWMRM